MALIRELLRIIHTLVVKNVSDNEKKMLSDIIYSEEFRLII